MLEQIREKAPRWLVSLILLLLVVPFALWGVNSYVQPALRGGITKVLIPKDNEKDLADVPEDVKQRLDIQPVRWIDEVFENALTALPTPLPRPIAPAESVPGSAEAYIAH